jgi:hypothetical protein
VASVWWPMINKKEEARLNQAGFFFVTAVVADF